MTGDDPKSSPETSSNGIQSHSSSESVLSAGNLKMQKGTNTSKKREHLLHEEFSVIEDVGRNDESSSKVSPMTPKNSLQESTTIFHDNKSAKKVATSTVQTKGSSGLKKNSNNEAFEKALLEMAPRKAKRMFDRRKRARENGEDEAAVLWDNPSSVKAKPHSLKQIQRLSNELDQVLGVLCNGDKSVAADVLSHLMTKRHMGSDLFQTVERNKGSMTQRTLDNRIVDGIAGFFEHHHSMGTRPTEAAHAVDAVMVACCWDICEGEENPDKTLKKDPPNKKRKTQLSPDEKKVSNSALIERLGVNRGALKRARAKARNIKVEDKTHYKPEDRKPRKDKGVPARLYSEVKKAEEAKASPRQKKEYAAIGALNSVRESSLPQHLILPPSYSPPLGYSQRNSALASISQSQNRQLAQMLYGNPLEAAMTSSDRPFILPRASQLHENVRNALYGHQGQSPGRGLDGTLLRNYNQYLQLNTPPLQPPMMGVNITPENTQGNLTQVQANILKDIENQNRNMGQEPFHGRNYPSKKDDR